MPYFLSSFSNVAALSSPSSPPQVTEAPLFASHRATLSALPPGAKVSAAFLMTQPSVGQTAIRTVASIAGERQIPRNLRLLMYWIIAQPDDGHNCHGVAAGI